MGAAPSLEGADEVSTSDDTARRFYTCRGREV